MQHCSGCPFFVPNSFHPVRARFSKNPIGVVVVEGPTQEDTQSGTFLSGVVSNEFNNSLERVGLKSEDLTFIHAHACRAQGKAPNATRAKAAQHCAPYFQEDLKGLEHLPKLLLGHAAVVPFTKVIKGGVDVMRGFVRKEFNAVVTFNPYYAYFRNPKMWGVFDRDLFTFKQMCDGVKWEEPRLNINPSLEDLKQICQSPTIAVDIETQPDSDEEPWSAKNPLRARLRSIGLGTGEYAVSAMWEDMTLEMQQVLMACLRSPQVTKLFHNGAWFDIPVLNRYGFHVVNYVDTRDLRKALSATSELSLRFVGSLYCPDIGPWKETEAAEDGEVK